MTDATLTLPEGLSSGTDWGSTLQRIAAYGAGRLFDAQAVSKIYKTSNQTPQMMDENGNLFTAGQPNDAENPSNEPMGIHLIIWLAGGVFLFMALRD